MATPCARFQDNPSHIRRLLAEETIRPSDLVGEAVQSGVQGIALMESRKYHFSNAGVFNSGYAVVEPIDFVIQLLWDN